MATPEPADTKLTLAADSKKILVKILNSTRDSVIVVDAQMRIVAANLAADEAFGHDNESIVNRRLSEVVRDAGLHDGFRWAVEQHKATDLRLENRSKKFDVHIAPLDIDDSPLAIGFCYDVSQVERLESIRQEFLSNISHELRTPLTSILAFVETLEDGAIEDNENNRRFLNVIRRNAERMRSLISDILELSMIESGRVAIEIRRVDLAAVVGAVFSDLSAKALERNVSLVNEVTPQRQVYADTVRLEQMLTNLVENAIKFNRDGGRVTLSHKKLNDKDVIIVSDTGEGILPEHVERIFERFYRADRARTSEVGGTGLGLAIVKHLARLHGGEVSVSSELGNGSAFSIELPAKLQ